jgi:hypothetical protein
MGSENEVRNLEGETRVPKVSHIPVECTAGHPISVVYFPMLDNYGFGCGVCHHLGLNVTATQDHGKLIEIGVLSGPACPKLTGDLLLFTEQKADKITCPKGHEIGVMTYGHHGESPSLGFSEPHCKLYAPEIVHRDRVLVLKSRFRGIPQMN